MPDKWEYPWYAAWDLAFHCVPLALVDPDFAKEQLAPAAARVVHAPERPAPGLRVGLRRRQPAGARLGRAGASTRSSSSARGHGDRAFLERVFHKLLLNFTWWVNRKDAEGNNVFQGGFLGLDNIGVFDRSAPLPTGGHLEQSDGTSWMAMYCLNMLRHRAGAGARQPGLRGRRHQVLRALPLHRRRDEQHRRRRHRAVGRARTASSTTCCTCPTATQHAAEGPLDGRPDPALRGRDARAGRCSTGCPASSGGMRLVPRATGPTWPRIVSRWHGAAACGERRLLSLVARRPADAACCAACSTRASSSRPTASARSRATTATQPVRARRSTAHEHRVDYEPAESSTGLFGGNSNWRGPIWFPVNYLLDRVAAEVPPLLRRRLHGRVPDRLRPAADARRGRRRAVAPARRASSCADADGRRPVFGGDRAVPDATRTGATYVLVLRVLPRRHRRRASAPATRPAGPALVAKLLQQSGA